MHDIVHVHVCGLYECLLLDTCLCCCICALFCVVFCTNQVIIVLMCFTQGTEFTIGGIQQTFRGSIAVVTADNLASQLIGGFKALNAAL